MGLPGAAVRGYRLRPYILDSALKPGVSRFPGGRRRGRRQGCQV